LFYVAMLIRVSIPVDLASTAYVSAIEKISTATTGYFSLVAVCILLTVIRTFKFFVSNSRLFLLWSVLENVSVDLFGILVSSVIIMAAFILFGYAAFGPDLVAFSGIGNSFQTAFNFVLGNPPDWGTLNNSNYVLGDIYIVLFSVLIFISLMNMLIAILNKGYSVVNARPSDRIFTGFGDTLRTIPMLDSLFDFLHKKLDKEDSEEENQLLGGGGGEEGGLPISLTAGKEKPEKGDAGGDGSDDGGGGGDSGSGVNSPKLEEKIDLLFAQITEMHKLLNEIAEKSA